MDGYISIAREKGTKRKRLVISKAKTRTIGDIIKDDHK